MNCKMFFRLPLPSLCRQGHLHRRICRYTSSSDVEALLKQSSISPDVRDILDTLLGRGREITAASAEILFRATGPDLNVIARAADHVRQSTVGGEVTYIVNRNINFTNVCIKRCGFCAFSRTGVDQQGYYLPQEEVVRRAGEAESLGATEVCIQAGLPPNMDGNLYSSLCRAITAKHPALHIHAFSPEEVVWGSSRSGMSVRDFLLDLKEAGVGSLPGTSAEILDNELRRSVAKGRLSVEQWVEVVTTAHSIGLPTTATMMYGFCETPGHLARHLVLLRSLQKQAQAGSGVGFTEFVPLGFVAAEAPLWKKAGSLPVRSGPTGAEVLRAHAVARLVFHPQLPGGIRNLQVSWVKEGLKMAQLLLNAGANDLGGTLMNESISTAAGSKHGQLAKPSELRRLTWELGPERSSAERLTTYAIKQRFANPASASWEAIDAAEAAASSRLSVARDHARGDEHLDEVVDATGKFGSFHELVSSDDFRFKTSSSSRMHEARVLARGPRAHGMSCSGMPAGRWSASTLAKTQPQEQQVVNQMQAATCGHKLQKKRFCAHSRPAAVSTRAVTYSPSFTLVPTYECFNFCTYCNFRRNITKNGRDWLSDQSASQRLQGLLPPKGLDVFGTSEVVEILVMSGEVHPKAPNRSAWLERASSICSIALDMGFLPHTNIGPLDRVEMQQLAAVNASMGLMLEQTASSLQAPGGVHRFAPSKNAELRIAQLRQAGELGVPFTTGLLVGIGEKPAERLQALEVIARAAEDFGHVQEVILQPHSLGSTQRLRPGSADDEHNVLFGSESLVALPGLVRAARETLPASVEIQIPPNLFLHGSKHGESIVFGDGWEVLLHCLQLGASDLGGISPRDEVNPDFQFPLVTVLADALQQEGYTLRPRLPVYPQHFTWLSQRVQQVLKQRLTTPKRPETTCKPCAAATTSLLHRRQDVGADMM
eukprot:TRINITY_DN28366_c0_g2_i1.p1 TRINITY_DN28366_c0_g2~~TRINITY_DN28366_c0_g2_i1.p1  ORF type:complete len:939 (+),score=156.19 TRINITY_DN28366_c0_g2_i1:45-2861(+)